MSQSKAALNRKKSRKGNKHYWSKHKLTNRETNFRIWLEKECQVSYSWYRTLPPYSRAEFKQDWYAHLEETGKSPTAKPPKKHRA